MAVRSSWRTNVYRVSLWVICVASRCVSCSEHLVVVVYENARTALVWNSSVRWKTLLWCFKFGISGFYGNVNEGWEESSAVHGIPTD